ncbi:Outer membrane protein OprM [Paraburkholderia ultramafica]|uniref:Outer membrane protein OprM n=1 Tax=Paraburkholderia ultramafica TaxID=1544867 RepID=A0A6S7BLA2_9BURK|nr:efflux transporter outer membrane subunit [Paraburkholderia ultramafica]CAB3802961.1 Outer membrane protein OprM [Paraburkholderia ultramafica]
MITLRALPPLAILSVMLMASCANTDGISPRSAMIDDHAVDLGHVIEAALTDANWPTDGWWSHWNDAQLDELVAKAVFNNPSLKIALARVDQADELARMAGASRYPNVSVSGDFTRTRFARYASPSPPGGNTVWSNAIGVNLGYELDLWGKHRSELEGALDNAQAASADARVVKLTLQTAVARTYVAFSRSFDERDVAEATLARQQNTVDIIERRVKAGLASPLEVVQARTPVSATRASIEEFNRQITLTRNALAVLIGEGPGAGASLVRPALRLDVPVALPATLPANLVARRPDIAAMRWRVETSAKVIDVARADFYPNIDLIATAGLVSAAFGGFFTLINNDALVHSFGAAISLPIFDGGLRKGRYGVAVASYDQAVETYNQTVLAAFRDVADQVTSLQSLGRQQIEIEATVESAQSAYDYAIKGYRAGIADYLSVLSTQTELLQAQERLTIVRAARLDSWAQLMMALGGGVEAGAAESAHKTTRATDVH